jgi:sugar diacid utilization regulator
VDLRERPGATDGTWLDLRRSEASDIIAVHAAGFRRNALVAQACGQIYMILPEPAPPGDEAALTRWVSYLVDALRRHTGTPVQAAIAGLAIRLDDIPEVKLRGWKTLGLMEDQPDRAVGSAAQVRAALILDDMLGVLREHAGLRDERVGELVRYDADRGSELARSLLAYLDAFGDVAKVAAALHVHPNTLRQRIRRAVEMTGLDLADASQRLVVTIELRLLLTGTGSGQDPFPVPSCDDEPCDD